MRKILVIYSGYEIRRKREFWFIAEKGEGGIGSTISQTLLQKLAKPESIKVDVWEEMDLKSASMIQLMKPCKIQWINSRLRVLYMTRVFQTWCA